MGVGVREAAETVFWWNHSSVIITVQIPAFGLGCNKSRWGHIVCSGAGITAKSVSAKDCGSVGVETVCRIKERNGAKTSRSRRERLQRAAGQEGGEERAEALKFLIGQSPKRPRLET